MYPLVLHSTIRDSLWLMLLYFREKYSSSPSTSCFALPPTGQGVRSAVAHGGMFKQQQYSFYLSVVPVNKWEQGRGKQAGRKTKRSSGAEAEAAGSVKEVGKGSSIGVPIRCRLLPSQPLRRLLCWREGHAAAGRRSGGPLI